MDSVERARIQLELDRAIYRLLGVIKILNQVLERIPQLQEDLLERQTDGLKSE